MTSIAKKSSTRKNVPFSGDLVICLNGKEVKLDIKLGINLSFVTGLTEDHRTMIEGLIANELAGKTEGLKFSLNLVPVAPVLKASGEESLLLAEMLGMGTKPSTLDLEAVALADVIEKKKSTNTFLDILNQAPKLEG